MASGFGRLRSRRHALWLYWGGQALALYVLWSATFLAGASGDTLWALLFVPAGIGVLTGLQAVLLRPMRRPGVAGSRGVPVLVSLGIVGLSIGVLAGTAVLTLFYTAGVYLYDKDEILADIWITSGVITGTAWVIATPLLVVFARGQPPDTFLRRLAAGLFIGTVVEAAAIIPFDVMVRRKSECACSSGTLLAMIICGTVGLFALGPAIFIPVFARRRKRWRTGRCEVCGYDLGASKAADRCPECGFGWKG